MKYTYILIDVETTGLNLHTDRIISIGAKVFDQDHTFHQHINPQKNNNAVLINGIEDSFLVKQKIFSHVIKDFWIWVQEIYNYFQEKPIVFIGHNFDYFDETILLQEHARTHTYSFIPQNITFYKLDTMKLTKYIFPFTMKNNLSYGLPQLMDCPESYSQVNIYKFLFGREPEHQHTALGDVQALEEILSTQHFLDVLLLCKPDSTRFN
jgi:DNA polymerase III epsilon subunit-like protein